MRKCALADRLRCARSDERSRIDRASWWEAKGGGVKGCGWQAWLDGIRRDIRMSHKGWHNSSTMASRWALRTREAFRNELMYQISGKDADYLRAAVVASGRAEGVSVAIARGGGERLKSHLNGNLCSPDDD